MKEAEDPGLRCGATCDAGAQVGTLGGPAPLPFQLSVNNGLGKQQKMTQVVESAATHEVDPHGIPGS